RKVPALVGGFAGALALARGSDLVATVPERHSGVLRAGLYSFDLPLTLPVFSVAMLWHPRQDADPAHRWLRQCVREVCTRPMLEN
ncbi:MAG: LysR family transcriptional regulator, partial [Pseudomonas sp.]